MIHKTAIISEKAKIGDNVSIGPFCLIEDDVEIGPGSVIASHVVLRKGTILADQVKIDSHVVLGGDPQSIGFDVSIKSSVAIGARTIIREGVTVHRASTVNGVTTVGEDCFLMAYSHVAHDCQLANRVILTNSALLAGHVQVGSRAVLGGNSIYHQFVRIGSGAMIGGGAAVGFDVPPFLMVTDRNHMRGLNLVGLKRAGYDEASIRELKMIYSGVYGSPGNPKKKIEMLKSEGGFQTELASLFFSFFEAPSKRGFMQWQQTSKGGNQE